MTEKGETELTFERVYQQISENNDVSSGHIGIKFEGDMEVLAVELEAG